MFIYLITNLKNGKKYVGQTIKTVEERFKRHTWATTLKNCKMAITLAIKKYGKENFRVEKLLKCDNLEELNFFEVIFSQMYNTMSPHGYNLKVGGRKSLVVSEETRVKISRANRGRKATPETIKKLSESHKGFKISDETKQKLSKINKGKRGTDKCYENAAKANQKTYIMINPFGEEVTIINMAKFCRDNNLSRTKMCEVVKHRAAEHKGWRVSDKDPNYKLEYKHSEETIQFLSENAKGRKHTEAAKQKMSIYWKENYHRVFRNKK